MGCVGGGRAGPPLTNGAGASAGSVQGQIAANVGTAKATLLDARQEQTVSSGGDAVTTSGMSGLDVARILLLSLLAVVAIVALLVGYHRRCRNRRLHGPPARKQDDFNHPRCG